MNNKIQWAVSDEAGRSIATSSSGLQNLYAEGMPALAKTPLVLYGTPGTSLFSKVEGNHVLALPNLGELQYALTNSTLSKINYDGTSERVGDVYLDGHVSWAENGTHLVFVDGKNGYSYTVDDGIQPLGGAGWYISNSVTVQEGYFIFNQSNTDHFFTSLQYSVQFDPTEYASATTLSDHVTAVISDHKMLWVFGSKSIDFWYLSGNADFVFSKMQGHSLERGVLAPASIDKINNTVIFLADDGKVYAGVSTNPTVISNRAVEYHIASADATQASSYTYTEEGHIFYLLTLPEINQTWVYDMSNGLWHRRSHYFWGRHHSSCYAYAFGKHLVGDAFVGKVHEMSLNIYRDDSEIIQRIADSTQLSFNRQRLTFHSIEIDMELGSSKSFGYGDNPQGMLQWSDDGGETYSNEHWKSLGKIGNYKHRLKFNQLGQSRQRTFRLTITDPIKIIIIDAVAEYTVDGD